MASAREKGMNKKQREYLLHADVVVVARKSNTPGNQLLAPAAFILESALMTPEVEAYSRCIHGVVSRSVVQPVPLLPQRRIRMEKGQHQGRRYLFHLMVFHRF